VLDRFLGLFESIVGLLGVEGADEPGKESAPGSKRLDLGFES